MVERRKSRTCIACIGNCAWRNMSIRFSRPSTVSNEDGIHVGLILIAGPDISPPAIRASKFALENAARLALIAVRSVATHHLPARARGSVLDASLVLLQDSTNCEMK